MLDLKTSLWLRNHFKIVSDKLLCSLYRVSLSTIKEWRKRLSLFRGHKDKWKRHKNPFKGKNHTKEVCEKFSRHKKNMWNDPKSPYNSNKYRQDKSDHMYNFNKKRPKENRYSHTKRGYRADIGNGKIFFRSAWEANYARFLNLQIANGFIFKWEFEPDTFWFEKIRRGVRSYTPDFKIWEKKDSEPYYVEVKGYMDSKSKTKIKRMAKYYPKVNLIIFESKDYKKLKEFSGMIKNWE